MNYKIEKKMENEHPQITVESYQNLCASLACDNCEFLHVCKRRIAENKRNQQWNGNKLPWD